MRACRYGRLGVHGERVSAIDAVNTAMVNEWQRTVTRRTGGLAGGSGSGSGSDLGSIPGASRTYIDYPYASRVRVDGADRVLPACRRCADDVLTAC